MHTVIDMIAIYKITNKCNLKVYVGQTRQPLEQRFLQHSKSLTPLGEAMRQYSLENFTIEVIEKCKTQEQANHQERFWIKVLKCKIPDGYNRSSGSEEHLIKARTISDNFANAMKLGEVIREYRLRNHMSMGDFSKASGISKPYISMLEANKNSNGGKPIAPSVETLQKVANAVGVLLDKLLRQLGDEEIDLRPTSFNEDEVNLLNGYRALKPEIKELVKGMIFQFNKLPTIDTGSYYGTNFHTNITVK